MSGKKIAENMKQIIEFIPKFDLFKQDVEKKLKSINTDKLYDQLDKLKQSVDERLSKIPKPEKVDLSGYALKSDIIKPEKIDLSAYALKSDIQVPEKVDLSGLEAQIKEAKRDKDAFESARRTFGEELSVLSLLVDKRLKSIESAGVDLSGYALKDDIPKPEKIDLSAYALKSELPNIEPIDLSGYALRSDIAKPEKLDLSGYILKSDADKKIAELEKKVKSSCDGYARMSLESKETKKLIKSLETKLAELIKTLEG